MTTLPGSASLPPALLMRYSATTARSSRATTTPWCAWSTAPLCPCAVPADMHPAAAVAGARRRSVLRARLRATTKATIALTREGTNGEATCFVSQHIGDVENGGTFDAWNAARTRLEDLFDLAPAALACDLHPSYLSDQWAREQARKCNLPLVEVQHHHAHIASVMAEAIAAGQLTTDTRVLGIAFDGTAPAPMGPFGAASFLLPALTALSAPRICSPGRSPAGRPPYATLDATPLPCSANSAYSSTSAAQLLDSLDEQTRSVTATMIERGINSPRTSSMGRLFDAAAAILGICDKATYEANPP